MPEASGVPARAASFEDLRHVNEHGAAYWSARDLQPLLGYSQWRRFEDAIRRAMTSCEQSGNPADYHFAGAGKMIATGKGAARDVADYHLSRFACYLIAQNGDPRKPAIAQAQKYFAIQTRRQELSDEQAAEGFKALSGAARSAGVGNRMFGVFHDAGYKGLYDERGVEAIKARKGIDADHKLMDRMNATELAANQFRMTQARDKLARDRVRSKRGAIDAHHRVGREVRAAIARIGGTMPEDIPADEHIEAVEKRIRTAPPKLALDGPEAAGLLGHNDPEPDRS